MPVVDDSDLDSCEIDSLACEIKENLSLSSVGPYRSKARIGYWCRQSSNHPYKRRRETEAASINADDPNEFLQELLNKGRLIQEAVHRLRLETAVVSDGNDDNILCADQTD
ncbi:Hypothetical protein NTJ_03071 [Nesidiocoris tenuis]|uniref:Uncharacterized protein n=1 Tax=Nesidiocoris tenuis TaxID=355587 RepID=A0ABN7AE35_9HEMI|nr:Hypothetical protein NTJ_03071 [Nesidiocoris tenuis]